MQQFRVLTNPYGDRLYSRRTVSFNPGLTVLIGCNGSGKTTLMSLLKEKLRKVKDAFVLSYDDRRDGGSNFMERLGFYGDMNGVAAMFMSSEGERIMFGIGRFVMGLRRQIQSTDAKQIWIFLDAVGSGLSIDGIDEIKDLAELVIGDNPEKDIYFVVSTNEYEFAVGADCIDVTNFRHVTFASYDEYRNYILKTRDKKDKRLEGRD